MKNQPTVATRGSHTVNPGDNFGEKIARTTLDFARKKVLFSHEITPMRTFFSLFTAISPRGTAWHCYSAHIRLELSKLLVLYSTAAVWWDRKGVAVLTATVYAATVSNARSTTKPAKVIAKEHLQAIRSPRLATEKLGRQEGT